MVAASSGGSDVSGVFSVPLIRQVTLPGRYPAHCPVEFGLSSRPGASPALAPSGASGVMVTRAGGRLAGCDRSLSHALPGKLDPMLPPDFRPEARLRPDFRLKPEATLPPKGGSYGRRRKLRETAEATGDGGSYGRRQKSRGDVEVTGRRGGHGEKAED